MGCSVSQTPDYQQFSFQTHNLSPTNIPLPQNTTTIQKQLDKLFIPSTPKQDKQMTPISMRHTDHQSKTLPPLPLHTLQTLSTPQQLHQTSQPSQASQLQPPDEVQRIFSKHEELKSKLKHYMEYIRDSKLEEQKIQRGKQQSNYSQSENSKRISELSFQLHDSLSSKYSQTKEILNNTITPIRFEQTSQQRNQKRPFYDALFECPKINIEKECSLMSNYEKDFKKSLKENSLMSQTLKKDLPMKKENIAPTNRYYIPPILKKDSLRDEYQLTKQNYVDESLLLSSQREVIDKHEVNSFIDHYEKLLSGEKIITQNSLLTKMEQIKQQFGIQDRQQQFQTESYENFCLRNPFKKRNREEQEQSFSLSPSPLVEDRPDNSKNIRVNSFSYQEESFKNIPNNNSLYQIQEEQVEETTEDDLKKHTPSLQDVIINLYQYFQIKPIISSREFIGYYDEKIKHCTVQIEKNTQEKESERQISSSQEYNTQLNIDNERKSFDQYYHEYVGDQQSGLDEEIGQMTKFLKKVKTAKSRLKCSLKDLYKTVIQNCDYGRQQTSQISYQLSSQSSSENDEPIKYNSMKQRILQVGQELEQIEQIRKQMIATIKQNCCSNSSISSLRSMKNQIQNSFGKVEQEIRVISECYSESDTKTFSSNENYQSRQKYFETELNSNQTQQTFEEYKKWNFNKNFQTENCQVFEYDEEESSTTQ